MHFRFRVKLLLTDSSKKRTVLRELNFKFLQTKPSKIRHLRIAEQFQERGI